MNKREEIIHEAIDLFSTKGYEKTTITDIIKKAQVSRGGFYHHYKDKSEILDDITDLYLEDFSILFKKIGTTHEKSYTDLITALFKAIIDFKIGQVSEWKTLQKIFAFKGNHQVIMRITSHFEELVTKVYTEIIKSGNKAGAFDVDYPELLAGLMTREFLQLIRAVQIAHKNNLDKLPKHIIDHIDFLDRLFSRELGVKQLNAGFSEVLESYLLKMNMEDRDDYSIK